VDLARRLHSAGIRDPFALDRLTAGGGSASVVTQRDKQSLFSYMVMLRDVCWHVSQDEFCHTGLVALVNEDVWSTVPAAFIRQMLCTGNEQVCACSLRCVWLHPWKLLCRCCQLRVVVDSPTKLRGVVKWTACVSMLLASLSQFAAQYDCLYGEQFQGAEGLPKELLAEEFVAEKLLEYWDALGRLWALGASSVDHRPLLRSVTSAVTRLLPICASLLHGSQLADTAGPVFRAMVAHVVSSPAVESVDTKPGNIETHAASFADFPSHVPPVSPMVYESREDTVPKTPAPVTPQQPALSHLSASVTSRTKPGRGLPSVVDTIMAKRRAHLSTPRVPSSTTGTPLALPATPVTAKLPGAPASKPLVAPVHKLVDGEIGELVLAAFAVVYRFSDIAPEAAVLSSLQQMLYPHALLLLSAGLQSYCSRTADAGSTPDAFIADVDLFPGLQALTSALVQGYFPLTLTAISGEPTARTIKALDLLPMVLDAAGKLSRDPAKYKVVQFMWKAVIAVTSTVFPSFGKNVASSAAEGAAVASLGQPVLLTSCRALLSHVSCMITSIQCYYSRDDKPDSLDWLNTYLLDASLSSTVPQLPPTGQYVSSSVATVLQAYVTALVTAPVPMAGLPAPRAVVSALWSFVDGCLAVLDALSKPDVCTPGVRL
jgi:hypothetical protein